MTGFPTVLVIDDDEVIGTLIEEVLRRARFQVAIATGGSEGVALARSLKPAAVICDARMPQMPGEEVVRQLKGDPETAFIPILLTSGFFEAELSRTQADGFLQKPFQCDELVRVVKEIVMRAGGALAPTAA